MNEDMTINKILEATKIILGENFKDDTEVVLENICMMVIQEAAEWTNRKVGTELLNECWPVITKCICMAYLNRGSEGLNSQSELGQQNVYNDWVTHMHKQITNRRHLL